MYRFEILAAKLPRIDTSSNDVASTFCAKSVATDNQKGSYLNIKNIICKHVHYAC